MNEPFPYFRVNVVGPFRFKTVDGTDCTPNGLKAQAILVLLVLSPDGRRSRSWIQAKLWSESTANKASNSLRRELSNLKQNFSKVDSSILLLERGLVGIDQSRVEVSMSGAEALQDQLEILEGLEVNEPEFETWLQSQRLRIEDEILSSRRQRTMAGKSSAIGSRNPQKVQQRLFPSVCVRRISVRATSKIIPSTYETVADEIMTGLATMSGVIKIRMPSETGSRKQADYGVEVIISEQPIERYKVNIQIYVEAANELFWSDRFELQIANGVEEVIARRVAEALQTALYGGDLTRHWSHIPAKQESWDEFQKGRVLENRGTQSALAKARRCYFEAIKWDSTFYPARVALGFTILDEIRLRYRKDIEQAKADVKQLCEDIGEQISNDPYAIALHAFQLCTERKYLRACRSMELALEKMPQSAELTGYAAAVFGYAGDHEREISYYKFAITLARHPPIWVFTNMIFSMVISRQGDVEELANFVESEDPSNMRLNLALLIHSLDNDDKPRSEMLANNLRKSDPGFSATKWRSNLFCNDDRRHTDILMKLRSLGF